MFRESWYTLLRRHCILLLKGILLSSSQGHCACSSCWFYIHRSRRAAGPSSACLIGQWPVCAGTRVCVCLCLWPGYTKKLRKFCRVFMPRTREAVWMCGGVRVAEMVLKRNEIHALQRFCMVSNQMIERLMLALVDLTSTLIWFESKRRMLRTNDSTSLIRDPNSLFSSELQDCLVIFFF